MSVIVALPFPAPDPTIRPGPGGAP